MNKIFSKRHSLRDLISVPKIICEGTKKCTLVCLGSSVESSSKTNKPHPVSTRQLRRLVHHFDKVEQGDTIVIEFGSDVLAHNWDEVSEHPERNHEPLVTLPHFRSSYVMAVDSVRSILATPVLLTLPPFDARRYVEHVSRDKDQQNIMRWMGWNLDTLKELHEQYNREIFSLAKEKDIPVVDLRRVIPGGNESSSYLEADGFRLNSLGNQLVEEAIKAIRL